MVLYLFISFHLGIDKKTKISEWRFSNKCLNSYDDDACMDDDSARAYDFTCIQLAKKVKLIRYH